MNASDDEVFEDTIESLASTKNSEIEIRTIATMPPKSAVKSMTSYKTLCVKRIKAFADAVKEYTGKTLALKQIEHLESIRDNLRDQEKRMNLVHEQFSIDEHEELAAATIIYNETITLVESEPEYD